MQKCDKSTPKPTIRQRAVLSAIVRMTRAAGWPPTLRELGDALDIASTNAVSGHLRLLQRKGLVHRSARATRALTLTEAGKRWVRGAP